MEKIYLIRHGKTVGNEKGWIYGAADVPLTEEGRAMLREGVEKGLYPSKEDLEFFTTGMERTEETFRIIFGREEREIIEGLRELNFGIYECRTFEEMKGDPKYEAWVNDRTGETRPEGGESINDFRRRVDRCFTEFLSAYGESEKDCLIVCHGGTIGTIMTTYFSEEKDGMIYRWVPEPGRGFVLFMKDGQIEGYEPI